MKLTGGVLYGYKGRYENKVPFNHDGWGLAVVPAIGYRMNSVESVQVGLLGITAAFFTYNRRF